MQLRIYDTRKQRRPVQSIEYGEYALNSVQPLNDPHKVAVADAAGNVIIIDTRTCTLFSARKATGQVGMCETQLTSFSTFSP